MSSMQLRNAIGVIFFSAALPLQAGDYIPLLEASSHSVGTRLGENLIVKEGCVVPTQDPAICTKVKYISAEPGRIGSIEFELSVSESFDVSMSLDDNTASGGGSGGQSLSMMAVDGSELSFIYELYGSSDCRSTNLMDTGGKISAFLTSYISGSSANNYRVGVYNGTAECYCNDTSVTYNSWPVEITMNDPQRLFNGVMVAGINDNDRLFDVKYRGAKLNSCGGGCTPTTPQAGDSIVISAVNGPQISVKGGYFKLDVTSGRPPDPADCAGLEHDGRVVLDNVSGTLYLCTQSGWASNR